MNTYILWNPTDGVLDAKNAHSHVGVFPKAGHRQTRSLLDKAFIRKYCREVFGVRVSVRWNTKTAKLEVYAPTVSEDEKPPLAEKLVAFLAKCGLTAWTNYNHVVVVQPCGPFRRGILPLTHKQCMDMGEQAAYHAMKLQAEGDLDELHVPGIYKGSKGYFYMKIEDGSYLYGWALEIEDIC